MHEGIDQQHEEHEQDRQPHDEHAEAVRTNLEGGRRRRPGQRVSDGANGGTNPGIDDLNPGAAADHGGAHEHRIGGILNIGCTGSKLARVLFHRVGLTGQQGLLDEKIVGFQHQGIGWNHVPCGEHDKITRHHVGHGHFELLAIANHVCPQRDRLAQAGCRLAGTVLLDKIQRNAEQHHDGDDEKVGQFPRHGGNRTGHEQQEDQRIFEAGKELPPQGQFLMVAEQVGAEFRQAKFGFGTRQAVCRRT